MPEIGAAQPRLARYQALAFRPKVVASERCERAKTFTPLASLRQVMRGGGVMQVGQATEASQQISQPSGASRASKLAGPGLRGQGLGGLSGRQVGLGEGEHQECRRVPESLC